jgi:TolB-like protein
MLTADPSREPEVLSPEQIELVHRHLNDVLASHAFAGSKRTQDFLRLIVGHALLGEFDSLRERMIGAEMFGRPIGYDTGSDSVVRVKATEVRKKLAQFYSESKDKRALRIELPSGSYVPRFCFESGHPAQTTHPEAGSSQPEMEAESVLPEHHAAEKSGTPTPAAPSADRRKGLPNRRVLVALLAGFVLIALAGYFGVKRWMVDSSARSEIRSIAILPLKNLSGDPAQEYFADGMTEELINDLGQVSTLRVISLTSAMSYKGTKKPLPQIARELSVDGVVEGGVLREGNQVRISAQLIDARADRPIWAHTYVRDLTSVLVLQGEVAQAIADEISINVTPQEQARLARRRPIDPEAQESYLHGMLQLDADDCKSAIEYFDQALDKNPNYAQAHAALANCYGRMGESGRMPYNDAFSKQKTEATRNSPTPR